MKALFLCSHASDVMFRVYDNETFDRLQALTGIERKVYTKEDILADGARFADAEYIFSTWGMPAFSEEEIRRYLPKLKCVFYGAGTVQSFARPFLRCGVTVCSAWAANAVPVAEMTVAQILLANKGYYRMERLYRESGDLAVKNCLDDFFGNYGATVGIIGAGMIGRLVISMLKMYWLNVIVFDPFLSDDTAAELGVEKVDLPTMFERAFVISNHLADNEQTKGMLDGALFKKMRENAVFINTGRGAQVVEADLVRVLRERPDLTALLDVTDPEPPAKEHPFFSLPNCVVTPHIAGSIGNEVARMGQYMLHEYEMHAAGEPCRYAITEAMLETMA